MFLTFSFFRKTIIFPHFDLLIINVINKEISLICVKMSEISFWYSLLSVGWNSVKHSQTEIVRILEWIFFVWYRSVISSHHLSLVGGDQSILGHIGLKIRLHCDKRKKMCENWATSAKYCRFICMQNTIETFKKSVFPAWHWREFSNDTKDAKLVSLLKCQFKTKSFYKL